MASRHHALVSCVAIYKSQLWLQTQALQLRYRAVAQLVARYTGGVEVAGSNPVSPTTKASGNIGFRGFFFFVTSAFCHKRQSFST